MPVAPLLIILLCLLGHAFFAGMETGVISIHRMRLRHFVRERIPGSKLLQGFLDDADSMLGTTLVGTNVCVVVISVVSASLCAHLYGPGMEPLSALGVAAVVLVLGEFLPKAWFHSRPIERCRRFAWLLRGAEFFLKPVSRLILGLTNIFLPRTKNAFAKPDPFVTREDLKILARESERNGAITSQERMMIHRVFDLPRKCASEIMIPAEQMKIVYSDTTLAEFFEAARTSGFTRMPVFDRTREEFTGIINVLFVLSLKISDTDKAVADFSRPPLFIRHDLPVDNIFPRLRRSRQPMCLVKGSDGKVAGLITTEDILEEIVGKL